MLKSKINALFLYPKTAHWTIELNQLSKILQSIKLIENSIPNQTHCYYAGDHFINHITFMGCAPNIQFNVTENSPNFCFVRLISQPNIQMINTNKLQRSPHCPNCKKTLKHWNELTIDTPWTCPHCQQTSQPASYDWRRTAGIARIFIEMTDIYPKEAIPQPSLLEKLQLHTQVEWDYFYYCA